MKILFTIGAIVALASCKGFTGYVVGDFGNAIDDFTTADPVFEGMSKLAGNEKVDEIWTVGDNIYPIKKTNPKPKEYKKMMDLFQKKNLKKLPVYATRGNHDCMFEWDN